MLPQLDTPRAAGAKLARRPAKKQPAPPATARRASSSELVLPSAVPRQPFDRAHRHFLAGCPDYVLTAPLDALRTAEYGRLDAGGHAYLDYTGGSLYSKKQVTAQQQQLAAGVFGNPHSANPTSARATAGVDAARRAVLDFFRADAAVYDVVFTANASAALKLVAEGYPFGPSAEGAANESRYLLFADNHNSVNGIREFAQRAGAAVDVVPLAVELRVDAAALAEKLAAGGGGSRLFAYPAQSNFSGVKHSLGHIAQAQALGWDVVLDAAAFAPTNELDLSAATGVQPDFACVSFYKLFGFPTGVGALIAKRAALQKLRRPWFAGGTVEYVSVSDIVDRPVHRLHGGHAAFEDGTVNYLLLPAVKTGLAHIASVGLTMIRWRVMHLTYWTLTRLAKLRHHNGAPLVVVLGPTSMAERGGTIAMRFVDPDGAVIDVGAVERRASAALISVRSGCFCNPGAAEAALDFEARLSPELRARMDGAACRGGEAPSCDPSIHEVLMHAMGSGALRISFGIASNFADAYRFVWMLRDVLNVPADAL
jgi:selenocysteine lyase/cysteine desulfurase